MANDDRRSEQFIREVDEEFRRAQMHALWQRFGGLFIGVCVLVVLATAGYRGWLWWQERQAARYGDAYLAAIDQLDAGQSDEAKAALDRIIGEGGEGYALLARLQLAASQAEAGESADAIASYDAVAADAGAPEPVRSLARIRAALLALGSGDADGAISRAEPLMADGNPWRQIAREVVGTARYEKGDYDAARQAFAAIQVDAEASASLRERANMMIALLDSQTAAPAAQGGAPDQPAQAEPAGNQGAQATDAAPEPAAGPQQ